MKRLRNQSGIITLDFIFAMVLVFAFSAILFALSFTLSVVEVVQYITYSSARGYFLAHINESKQRDMGKKKFTDLTSNQVLSPLFKNGWFELGQIEFGDYKGQYPEQDADRVMLTGARVSLNARLLEIRVPFFGRTNSDENVFSATLNSYLSREPSDEECRQFNRDRYQAILTNLGYGGPGVAPQAYVPLGDNGC